MSAPPLELRALSKRFGALTVTDAVSLDLRPGEVHALIGPNGAGKTSLMHQIAGALAPESGQVLIDGVDMTAAPPQARARAGLARTFQITSIIPSLTALANAALAVQARAPRPLALFARPAGDARLEEPARAALARAGLADHADALAGALSHGQKRALEIAMALAGDPKIILFDEPVAGMSRQETQRIVDLLASLKGRYAMLLVEHDMDAVFSLADRVSVLVYGRIVATGTPAEIRCNDEVRAHYIGEGD